MAVLSASAAQLCVTLRLCVCHGPAQQLFWQVTSNLNLMSDHMSECELQVGTTRYLAHSNNLQGLFLSDKSNGH